MNADAALLVKRHGVPPFAAGCEHTGNEGKKVMRIVLIGISHWHTPFYSDPVLRMKNATIVGVSDPDAERAAPLAAQAKCPVSLACLNLVGFS